jgi:hypothetical protein|tara:strand:- start:53 stop:262 length:210 start_codon:yes stop_codon:yes gene_type:complete
MIAEKANLINDLGKIEQEIQLLWEYHPDNPEGIDVVERFNKLQQEALALDAHIQTLWTIEYPQHQHLKF